MAPLPRVSVRPVFSRFGARRLGGLFGAAPSSPSSAFLPRRRSAAARSRPPTPFGFGLLRRFGLLGFRVRVVLAADQLDLRDLGAVAAAVAEAQDAGVAARPRLEARRDGVEQLAHDLAILDVAQHQPARVQRLAVLGAARHATLGDGDDPLDERPQLLGARHGGLDPLVLQQRVRLVAQHRDAMLGDPSQFPVCYSMTHCL